MSKSFHSKSRKGPSSERRKRIAAFVAREVEDTLANLREILDEMFPVAAPTAISKPVHRPVPISWIIISKIRRERRRMRRSVRRLNVVAFPRAATVRVKTVDPAAFVRTAMWTSEPVHLHSQEDCY